MKVTYPGHANLLVEGRLNFMCDPWLVGEHINNCTVWFYPPRRITIADLPRLDFIFVSHDHPDHCNEATVRALPKDIPFYILNFPNNHDVVKTRLKKWGVKTIHVLEPKVRHQIEANTFITIYPSDVGFIDSAAVIEHDGKTFLHANDCELSMATFREIGERFKIDIAFLPYAGFSGFPAMYEFPIEVRDRLAHKKKIDAVRNFFEAAQALRTKYAVPAAGDLVILKEEYAWSNYYDRTSPDEVVSLAKTMCPGVEVLSMRAGDAFEFDKGFLPHPLRNEWGYNEKDQQRYAKSSTVLPEMEAFNSWLTNIDCDDFQDQVVAYFRKGIEVNRGLANHVGDYLFTLRTTGKLQAEVTINFADLSVKAGFAENYTKKMILDGYVLLRIMRQEILWGDAYSSCSIILDRRPPEYYNTKFWSWLYNLDALGFYDASRETTPRSSEL